MKLSDLKFYGHGRDKLCRLGLTQSFLELNQLLIETEIRVVDKRQANDADFVCEMIDDRLGKTPGWVLSKSGCIRWVRRFRCEESFLSRLGVEIRVSGCRALLARDIVRLRNSLQDSHIDVGVIVVPSDEFEYRLTDRVANFTYALRYVEKELREAQSYPIVLIAIEHDGYSDVALPKKTTNRGKGSKGKGS